MNLEREGDFMAKLQEKNDIAVIPGFSRGKTEFPVIPPLS